MEVKTPGSDTRGFSFALSRDADGRLCLRAEHHPQYGPIVVDWLAAELKRRIAAGRRQPLARALGMHKKPVMRVVDATGGLGRDAFTLAALGAEITLIERHPSVFALLQDAQVRAAADQNAGATATRITLIQADAIDWLAAHPDAFDAVYLDPMYPEDGKAALPSKEMQILRELTGGDADADHLLLTARATGKRVAVKRPRQAPVLAQRKSDAESRGTQVRFDIYLPEPPSARQLSDPE